MVVCGVVIQAKDEAKLLQLGVKESKALTRTKREDLAPLIKRVAKHVLALRIPANRIDWFRRRGVKLDEVEAMKFAHLINTLPANCYYVDSPGINPKRFEALLKVHLKRKVKLVVENFADKKYVVVAAASIIGKVLRDKVVERLKRRVSYDFGVGYSHDARSVKFVEKLLKERKHLPPYVRQTWNTVKELKKQVMRKSLKEFVEGR